MCGKVPGGQQQGKRELPSLSAVASDVSDHMTDLFLKLLVLDCVSTHSHN